MKQKFLIIAFLVFSLMAAFALKSKAQTIKKDTIKSYQLGTVDMLADETTLIETKTGAKITCSNDQVHFKLYEKWQHVFKHYTWTWKKDRKGLYKEYTITISKKDAELIKQWTKEYL